MVNIDNALRIVVDEIVGENLHVAGEDHEIGVVLFDQRMDLFLGLPFILLCDRDDGVWDFVEVGDRLVVRVIGDDQRDVAGKFAALVSIQEIDEAVVIFRDQDDHARAMRG